MATQDQILKVVAGLFNGAPGGAILGDLTGAVESGLPVHELAAILADLDLFKEIVPDTATTEQKVETLLNNFGLEPGGEEGSAAALAKEYFTARIEEGADLGHIVYEAVVYLEQEDLPEEFAEVAALLDNKALVARVHAENYANIDSVDDGQALFEGVTSEFPLTEEEALEHVKEIAGEPDNGGEEPPPPSDLAEALAALQAAQDARAEFLEEAAENESVAAALEDLEGGDDEGNVAKAIDNALTTTADNVGTALDIPNFKQGSAATQAAQIVAGRSAAQDVIDDAQAAVAAYNAEIAKVEGLADAIAAVKTAEADHGAATTAFNDVNAQHLGAVATFQARNTSAANDGLDNNANIQLQKSDDSEWVVGDDLADLAKIVDIGNDDAVLFTHEDGELTDGDDLGDYNGVNAFQTSLQALIDAKAAQEAAYDALNNADPEIGALAALAAFDEAIDDSDLEESDSGAVLIKLKGLEEAVETAEGGLQELEDAIAAWEAVTELKAGLDGQDEAVAAARKVLTDPVDEGGFGIDNLIELDGEQAGVDDDAELFLFVGNEASIDNFGEDDLVFFGSNYTFVELTEDQSIGDRVGNANTLEIFWQVDGDNVNLYVEQDAVSGSALGADEITTVTLVGVTDVTFEGGFVSIAAAA